MADVPGGTGCGLSSFHDFEQYQRLESSWKTDHTQYYSNDFKPANITWILNNTNFMPKLKYFLLNAALPIAKIVMVFNVLFTRCQAASQRLRRSYISASSWLPAQHFKDSRSNNSVKLSKF